MANQAEKDYFAHILEGKSFYEIARDRGVSARVVFANVKRCRSSLSVPTLEGLAAYFDDQMLITGDTKWAALALKALGDIRKANAEDDGETRNIKDIKKVYDKIYEEHYEFGNGQDLRDRDERTDADA